MTKGCLVLVGAYVATCDQDLGDEGSLLAHRKVKLHDEFEEANTFCNTVFAHEGGAAARDLCAHCVGVVKEAAGVSTANSDINYSRAPGVVRAVASCMLGDLEHAQQIAQSFPPPFSEKIQACDQAYGLKKCALSAAECGAVHYPKALEDCGDASNPIECIVESPGFLSCLAHRLGSGCVNSPLGASTCLGKALECIDERNVQRTDPEFATCMEEKTDQYFEENPAQRSRAQLCGAYYPDALDACDTCANTTKAAYIEGGGKCEGEYCMKVPAILQGMVMCMLPTLPRGFHQVGGSCATAYPDDEDKCKKSAAECLALQPCTTATDCANSDGWAACFAHKMEFDACHHHPAGMAACMRCGHECIIKDPDCTATVDTFTAEANCVECHRRCVGR